MQLHFQILLKPCTLHAPSNALSQCPAYAQPMPMQPMLSQCPAYMPMQPMLSQYPAYAQCSANAQPMLSQCPLSLCPAYAQLPKMPSQCLANAYQPSQCSASQCSANASMVHSILDRIFLTSIEILWSN